MLGEPGALILVFFAVLGGGVLGFALAWAWLRRSRNQAVAPESRSESRSENQVDAQPVERVPVEQLPEDQMRMAQGTLAPLHAFIEKLPIGIVLRNGEQIMFNQATSALIGYEPAEITTLDEWFQKLHGAEAQETRATYERERAEGFPNVRLVSLRAKDGREYWVDVSPLNSRVGEIWLLNDVTAREFAIRALRQSEAQFRALFEYASAGVAQIETATGRFLMLNQRYCDILGYSREEMLQLTFQQVTHPDDLPGDLEYMERLRSGEIPNFSREKRYYRKDGAIVWGYLNVSPLWKPGEPPTSHIAVVQDITEHKRMDRALMESEKLLRDAEVVAGLGSYVLDIIGGVWSSSAVLDEIFGIDASYVRSVDGWTALIHPAWQEKMSAYFLDDVIGKRGHFDKEYKIVRQNDHQERWVYGRGELELDAQGNPVTMMGTIMDITERKRTEDVLRQSEKLAAIGKLVAGVAHELNNPLTSVILYSQLVQQRLADHPAGKDLDRVVSEALRASKIVRDLRDFARQRAIEKKPVQINGVLKSSLELVSYEMRAHSVLYRLSLEPDLPVTMADAHQLQQVFVNLINNAWQAVVSSQQGGEVFMRTQVGTPELWSAPDAPGRVIRVVFEDNGPGIPEHLLSRVFDPFFTTKSEGQGTGLGLSICHGIIAEHEGRIWAERNFPQGARFVIELPVVSPESAEWFGVDEAFPPR